MTPAERESLLQDLDHSRESLLRTVGGLTSAQLVSVPMLVVGIALMIFLSRRAVAKKN